MVNSVVNRVLCHAHHRILLAIELPVTFALPVNCHPPIPPHLLLQPVILPADLRCRETGLERGRSMMGQLGESLPE